MNTTNVGKTKFNETRGMHGGINCRESNEKAVMYNY